MHFFSIAVGVVALVTGLIAAYWWYQSAQIVPVPSWAAGEPGVFSGVEPGDSQLSDSGWIAALLVAAQKSADLNRRAALWTAFSVLAGAIAGFAGNIS
ncbi:MAG: hypothetical protein WA624_06505 [Methylocella sp.]